MSLAKDVVPDRVEATLVPCLDDTVVLRATFKRQSFAPHSHPTYVLALITRGALRFRCQNKVLIAPSGSACLINPNEVQTGEAATEVGWSYWSAYVPASVFGTGGARSDSKPSTPLFERRVLSDPTVNRALISFFSGVHASHPGLARTELLLDCLSQIAEHCGSDTAWRSDETDPRPVRRAKDFMAENYARVLTLEDVARACEITGCHLTRTFKKHTGLALHAWLVQHRVERARAMLIGGGTAADIAQACGFSDQPHMTRWFRRMLGLTPGNVQAMSRTFKIGPTQPC